MFRLGRIGMTLLKNSKMLTFSAFLSIFAACFLSISMYQLSSNVESSMEMSIEAKKGKFDIRVTKSEGKCFDSEEIKSLKQDKDVKGSSSGYQTEELLDAYTVGVINDDINKSLYKYSKDVKENSIIINDILAQRENKKVGDVFSVDGSFFRVIEVIKTNSISDYKMPMVIMELSQFHKLLGHTDTKQVNYMLLACEDSAFENVEYGGGIVNRIMKLHPDFNVSDQNMGADYSTFIKNIKMIFHIFFVLVIVISGLFVVSIFSEYIRKYRKDMAVIRMVGGKQHQVQTIVSSMSIIISGCGCLAGAVFSALASSVTLNWFNDKVQLFEGSACINWKILWQITITVFVLFNVFIYVYFYFGQNILPVQVFQETSCGLKKSKKANRFLVLRRIFGKSGYLGIKLMASKFRQNFMMILIIALITAIAYTGQASLKLLKANDNWYNYCSVQGKEAKAELYNDKPLSVSYAKKIYHRFEPVLGGGFMIYGSFRMKSSDEYDSDLNSFKVSDLKALPRFLQVDRWKEYKSVPKTRRVVVNETVAARCGYQLGDKVLLESEYLAGKKDFILVEIIKGQKDWNYEYNYIIDWDNLNEMEVSEENSDGEYIGVWFDGDKKLIREKIQELQLELDSNSSFDWFVYDDMMEQSEHIVAQWTTTLHIVLIMLLIVAGIGLLNSANGMLLAREKEYQILRMLGESRKNIYKICWIQVISYMLSGVVLGAIIGVITVYGVWKGNVISNASIIIEWEYLSGIALYLFGISLLLSPTIRKI